MFSRSVFRKGQLVLSFTGAFVFATAIGAEPLLVDIAPEVGLEFQHFNGMTGALYFPEMTGQGGALLDFDGDGDLDIYLVQGALFEGDHDRPLDELPGKGQPRDRLFRNDLFLDAEGRARPRFVDVTEASGLEAFGYGMGVAVGDFDDDGFPDLYLTNYGANELWKSRGDGTFENVTANAGVGDDRWSASASFLDFDDDGHLDLYVANYVVFSVEENPTCYATSTRRDYCGPASFEGVGDRLYRNRGDGSFEDVSRRFGLKEFGGSGLGVISLDVDGDGRTDWAVANDGEPNFLWRNLGGGKLSEEGLLAGIALNSDGKPEASMGVAAGDFDRDGDEDLFFAHLDEETNTLFVNQDDGLFEDRTRTLGLGSPSIPFTSFGVAWVDIDRDGWLDLAVASGAVRILENLAVQGDEYPLELPNQLYRNLKGQGFELATETWAPEFSIPEVSRGLVAGDIDLDGDADLLLINNRGPVRLFENRADSTDPWVAVLPRRDSFSPDLGARILLLGRERTEASMIRTDGSYASATDAEVIFSAVDRPSLQIDFPDGRILRWARPPVAARLTCISTR